MNYDLIQVRAALHNAIDAFYDYVHSDVADTDAKKILLARIKDLQNKVKDLP